MQGIKYILRHGNKEQTDSNQRAEGDNGEGKEDESSRDMYKGDRRQKPKGVGLRVGDGDG